MIIRSAVFQFRPILGCSQNRSEPTAASFVVFRLDVKPAALSSAGVRAPVVEAVTRPLNKVSCLLSPGITFPQV